MRWESPRNSCNIHAATESSTVQTARTPLHAHILLHPSRDIDMKSIYIMWFTKPSKSLLAIQTDSTCHNLLTRHLVSNLQPSMFLRCCFPQRHHFTTKLMPTNSHQQKRSNRLRNEELLDISQERALNLSKLTQVPPVFEHKASDAHHPRTSALRSNISHHPHRSHIGSRGSRLHLPRASALERLLQDDSHGSHTLPSRDRPMVLMNPLTCSISTKG